MQRTVLHSCPRGNSRTKPPFLGGGLRVGRTVWARQMQAGEASATDL